MNQAVKATITTITRNATLNILNNFYTFGFGWHSGITGYKASPNRTPKSTPNMRMIPADESPMMKKSMMTIMKVTK